MLHRPQIHWNTFSNSLYFSKVRVLLLIPPRLPSGTHLTDLNCSIIAPAPLSHEAFRFVVTLVSHTLYVFLIFRSFSYYLPLSFEVYLRVNSWIGLSCLIRVSSSCLSIWCIILFNSATLLLNSSSSSRWVWVLLDKSCRYPSWLACSRGKGCAPPLDRLAPPSFPCSPMLLLPDPVAISSPNFLAISIVWVAISLVTCATTANRLPWQIRKFPLVSTGRQEIRVQEVQEHKTAWGFS